MSPILGIWASQISGHLWAPSGAYDAIASTTLSASAASITFSGIPSTYTHLQIRYFARDNRANVSSYLGIRLNGDSGSNYINHYLAGSGSVAYSGTDGVLARYSIEGIPGGNATASVFGAGIIDILDYTSTNKNKTMRTLVGDDLNGDTSGRIFLSSGLWFATPAAINSITILNQSAGEGLFSINSSFALYGIL